MESGGRVVGFPAVVVWVVDVPDGEGLRALLFAGPGAGVEEFFGEDAIVALDFAVVAWGVGVYGMMR
ncbi:hypothetical protein GCM10009743_64650 [Kribbella swartbergensis]